MTLEVKVPPTPTTTMPLAHDGVELVQPRRFAAAATTVTDTEPLRVPSVTARDTVSALCRRTDAVPIPAAKVTVAG